MIGRGRFLSRGTNAIRLIDGAGSGREAVEIDEYDGRWVVQTRGTMLLDWLGELISHPEWMAEMGVKGIYWKKLGEEKGAPVWVAGTREEEPFEVREYGALRFWIDLTAGYSQGLFLDQRENRRETRVRAEALSREGRRAMVLNCFAYTCSFGVAAAMGGASTVNVDLSKRYLEWGRKNYALNEIGGIGDLGKAGEDIRHEFLYGEVGEWLERFARKRRKFDLIILDPPTFSRDKTGKVFTVEGGFPELVRQAGGLLTERGSLFCSTNQRSLTGEGFRRLIGEGLPEPGEWRMEERRMPEDFTEEKYLKAVWVDRR